ncbi:hypothetical protein GCM10023238_17700 [Streptomyces heliomycini]
MRIRSGTPRSRPWASHGRRPARPGTTRFPDTVGPARGRPHGVPWANDGPTAEVNGEKVGEDLLSHLSRTFEEMTAYASRGTRVAPGSGTCGDGGCLAELRGRRGEQSPPPAEARRHRHPHRHRRPRRGARSPSGRPAPCPGAAVSDPRPTRLLGKVVVITGAARGQGAAEAEALPGKARVVATDVTEAPGRRRRRPDSAAADGPPRADPPWPGRPVACSWPSPLPRPRRWPGTGEVRRASDRPGRPARRHRASARRPRSTAPHPSGTATRAPTRPLPVPGPPSAVRHVQHGKDRADRSHHDGRHPADARVADADPAAGPGQGRPTEDQPERPHSEGQVGTGPPVADDPALGGPPAALLKHSSRFLLLRR